MKEQIMKELSTGLEQIQNLKIQATGPNVEIIRLCISAFLDAYKWIDSLELPEEVHVVGTPLEKEPEEQEKQEEPNEDGREI